MRHSRLPIGIRAYGDGVTRRERIARPAAAAHDRCWVGLNQPLCADLVFNRQIDMRVLPLVTNDGSLERDDTVEIEAGVAVMGGSACGDERDQQTE